MGDPLVLPRLPRRTTARASSWWSRALLRTVEELAFDAADLREARTLARSGRVGATVVLRGLASAAVDPGTPSSVLAQVKVAALGEQGWADFAAATASETGHLAALEVGVLPDGLVEAAEEAGVELVPGVADLDSACECAAWAQPCVHVLALLQQLAWRVDAEPQVLLLLRGLTYEELVELTTGAVPQPEDAVEAAARAAAILDLAAEAPTARGLSDTATAAYDEQVAGLVDPP